MRVILSRVAAKWAAAARETLIPAFKRERVALGLSDAAGDDVRAMLEYLQRLAERDAGEADGDVEDEIWAEERRQRRRWIASINAGVGIDMGAMLQADDVADLLGIRAAAVSSLMRSITSDMQSRVAQAALSGIYGSSTDAVAKAIAEALSVAQRRARLIARDQMSKLNSSLNEYRQREIGVERYRWKTLLDGRERPHHHARNNDVFSWDSPPPGGHPGTEINCRCRALAIIDLPGEEGALVAE